jgi:dTDP-4-dehydrorhamnose 3,5-epimerase
MKVVETALAGVRLIELPTSRDVRGSTIDLWHANRFREAGLFVQIVQALVSVSTHGVLRGLHFQQPHPQGKLVTVLHGSIFDVVLDIRVGSPTFGRWISVSLSADDPAMLVIPEGFAHGFQVISERATVAYKLTDFYRREAEGGIAWNDPDLSIAWPLPEPILSDKDRAHQPLRAINPVRLPRYASAAS